MFYWLPQLIEQDKAELPQLKNQLTKSPESSLQPRIWHENSIRHASTLSEKHAIQLNQQLSLRGVGLDATCHGTHPLRPKIVFFFRVLGGYLVRAPTKPPPLIMLSVSSLPAVIHG
jgi:hypothetical protein